MNKKIKTSWNLNLLFSGSDSDLEKDKKIVSEKSSGFIDKWKDRNDYLKDPSVLKTALDEYEYLNGNFGTSGNAGFYFELKSSLDQNDPKIKAKFKNKFDLVIDLEIVSRYTALLSYLSGAKIKVGFEITGQNKDKFYDFKVLYHESKHISEMFLNTLKTLGLETVPRNPLPPVFANDTEEAFILKKYGVKKPYVVININASELAYQRRLAPEQFSLIIKNISDFFPEYSIILIGSKEETNYVGGFKNVFLPEIRNVFDLSGKTNLSELFFIISEARLVISNDSGPAHAASSFGVPSIVFFGPESPTIYAPQGGEKTIFYSRIHCSPCISVYKDKKIKCQFDAECLTGIDVGKINKKVLEYLKNNRDKNHRNNFKEI